MLSLESMAQDVEFRSEYAYGPLANADAQVRLLRFSKAVSATQIVQAIWEPHRNLELQTFDLVEAPTYNAISYTWGVARELKVSIGDRERNVRVNCLQALEQAYEYEPDGWFWIDSICINQDDITEKARQVGMMWKIYETAFHVLACIGPAENDSKLLAEMAAVIDEKADFSDGAEDWLPWLLDQGEQRVARLCSAYEAFSNRSYWSRLWIVQELSAAQSVWISCGDDFISWQALEIMFDLLHDVNSLLPEDMCRPSAGSARNTPLEAVILFDQDTPLDMGHIFTNFGDFKCADVRDRLYGLLHIVKWPEGRRPITPDYSKPVFALALETASYLELFRIEDMLAAFEIDSSHRQMVSLIRSRQMRIFGLRDPGEHAHEKVSKLLYDHFSLDATTDVPSPGDMKTFCARITRDVQGHLTAPLHQKLNSRLTNFTSQFQPYSLFSVPDHIAAVCHDGNFQHMIYEDEIVALTCSDTKENDILVHFGQEYQGILLVLRQTSPTTFNVVGQGVTGSMFDATSKEVFEAHVEVSMTPQDILLLVGQDLVGKQRPLELSLRRLDTRPLMFPDGAVNIEPLET